MPHRYNHYDQAFAAYLRHHRRPCVAVDESRRALAASASLKSPDFVVSAGAGPGDQWLIDVKGRKFPTGGGATGSGHLWENWVTRDDIESLLSWESAFGGQFRGLLVFAYELLSDEMAGLHEDVWSFREHNYAFYAVTAREYSRVMRPRSASWETVSLPAAQFRRLRVPLARMLSAEAASDAIPVSLATGAREVLANRSPMTPTDV
jgi:hypothetical protein